MKPELHNHTTKQETAVGVTFPSAGGEQVAARRMELMIKLPLRYVKRMRRRCGGKDSSAPGKDNVTVCYFLKVNSIFLGHICLF